MAEMSTVEMVLIVLGVPLRHALGDGRAEGDPRFPRPRVR